MRRLALLALAFTLLGAATHEIEIHFPPGTHQERLSGIVSPGYDVVYKFAASAGQQLKVTTADPHKHVYVKLYPHTAPPVDVHVGSARSIRLTETGVYRLRIEAFGSGFGGQHYDLTLSLQ